MNKDLRVTSAKILEILETTDWHQTLPAPYMTVKVIEAKARLMDANKKLMEVLKQTEK